MLRIAVTAEVTVLHRIVQARGVGFKLGNGDMSVGNVRENLAAVNYAVAVQIGRQEVKLVISAVNVDEGSIFAVNGNVSDRAHVLPVE